MEKELNIILNREDEEVVDISSNFQEDLELLEIEEVAPIILDLLNSLTKKIKGNIIQQEVGERVLEDIENDEAQVIIEKADEEISNYIGNLFLEIINFVNNLKGEEQKTFDYSLAVYGISESSNTKEIYETFHYGNVQVHEKLLSSMAFYKDIVDELIRKNCTKQDIKQSFSKAFSIMLYNIYNYIEKK